MRQGAVQTQYVSEAECVVLALAQATVQTQYVSEVEWVVLALAAKGTV